MRITFTILRAIAAILAGWSGAAAAGQITVRNDGATIVQRTSGQLNSQSADIGRTESAPAIEQSNTDRPPARQPVGGLYRVPRNF